MEHTFNREWRYRHRNPYHAKLADFTNLVLRDHEAEECAGLWNRDIFKRPGRLCLEIGTGYGHFMRQFCADHPEVNFVGLDYRFKRSFNLAQKLSRSAVRNARLLRARGERTPFMFAEGEVDTIFYFFPDPWPKKRHHKKRLFCPFFLESVYKILRPGGSLFLKTDHEGNARWMREVMDKVSGFSLELESFDLRAEYPEHFLSRYTTKFEKIFLTQGIPIKAFVLTKVGHVVTGRA